MSEKDERMSNCIYILRGEQIVLKNDEIDIAAFRAAVESAENDSIPWWYLGATQFKGTKVVLNIDSGRSGHTFRSLYATLLFVGRFMKKRKRISFVMKQEDDSAGRFRKHYYIGKFTSKSIIFRIEEYKSSDGWQSPLCWECSIFVGDNPAVKIAKNHETSYVSPLHALLSAISNLQGDGSLVTGCRPTFKKKDMKFTPIKQMISINGGKPVECEGAKMSIVDENAPFIQNAPFQDCSDGAF